jgi:hypothetical protein
MEKAGLVVKAVRLNPDGSVDLLAVEPAAETPDEAMRRWEAEEADREAAAALERAIARAKRKH